MYNLSEELLYLIDAKHFLSSKIKVKIKDKKELEAEVWGDNLKNYASGMHIKAVTYNEMYVKQVEGKWVAQVVLDI